MGVRGQPEQTLKAGQTFDEGPDDAHIDRPQRPARPRRPSFVVFLLKDKKNPVLTLVHSSRKKPAMRDDLARTCHRGTGKIVSMGMNDATATFSALRPRLHGIAYRMLGSVAESEDVVQDIWLSWNAAEHTAIENRGGVAGRRHHAPCDRPAQGGEGPARGIRRHLAARSPSSPTMAPRPRMYRNWQATCPSRSSCAAGKAISKARAALPAARGLRYRLRRDRGHRRQEEAACRQLVHRAKDQLRDERPRHAHGTPRGTPRAHAALRGGVGERRLPGHPLPARRGCRPQRRRRWQGHQLPQAHARRPAHRAAVLCLIPALRRRRGSTADAHQRRMGFPSLHRRPAGIRADLRDGRREEDTEKANKIGRRS